MDDLTAVADDPIEEDVALFSEIKAEILDMKSRDKLGKRELVKASRWVSRMYKDKKLSNMMYMLPFFQLKGEPYSLQNHYMFSPMFDAISPMRQLWKCCRQVGKCCRVDDISNIRLANGAPMTEELLVPGTEVMSSDGHRIVSKPIRNVWHTGHKAVLRITTRMGSTITVTPDHRLLTETGYVEAGRLRVRDHYLVGLRRGGSFRDSPRTLLEISVTGYCLGDGSTGNPQDLRLIAACPEVVKDITEILDDAGSAHSIYLNKGNNRNVTDIRFKQGSPAVAYLHAANMVGKRSWEKEIPSWVYDLSFEDTCTFLEKLWATDGRACNKTKLEISYTSTSEKLAKGVRSLLNKIGIMCKLSSRRGGYKDTDDVYHRCRTAYTVRVEGAESAQRFSTCLTIPGKPLNLPFSYGHSNRDTYPTSVYELVRETFRPLMNGHSNSMRKNKVPSFRTGSRLSRFKLATFIDKMEDLGLHDVYNLKSLLHADTVYDEIVSVEPAGTSATFDIEVEDTHNFVLDGVVSHNSQNSAGSEMLIANCTPHLSTLLVTPLFEQVKRLSQNYFAQLSQDFMFPELLQDPECVKSVLMRTYRNQAKQFFSYAYLNADRIRGIAADRLYEDEIQDFDASLLPVIEQCLAGTKNWGSIRKTGTPKTYDNIIQEEWDLTSMAEWATPCEACNHWNFATVSMDLLKMIGKKGPICSKCSKRINPRMGSWVHAVQDRIATYAGYHVSQPIHPYYFENKLRWYELLYSMAQFPTARFWNECLGESCDSSEKLVSLKDIYAACKEAEAAGYDNSIDTALKRRRGYRMTAMGIDWGGGGGDNTTSSTVVSFVGLRKGSDVCDVLYSVRLRKSLRPEEEAKIVVHLARKLKPTLIPHDYTGAGNVRESTLVQLDATMAKVLMPFTYGANAGKQVVSYHESPGGSRSSYYIDKPRSLMIMASMLRYGKIQFPKYASIKEVADDLLSLYEDRKERAIGSDITLIQKAANRSDDFAHSINFACSCLWYANQIYPNFTDIINMDVDLSDLQAIDPGGSLDIQDWQA